MLKGSASRKTKISSFPRDALNQAEAVMIGWNEVGKKLFVPNLSVQKFLRKLDEAKKLVDEAEQLKLQRAKAIQERNMCLSELWDLTKRVRNAAKATFGDYSPELQLLLNLQNSASENYDSE
ncbi:MAG: hypothetical protein ACE5IR_19805 [bacterium]